MITIMMCAPLHTHTHTHTHTQDIIPADVEALMNEDQIEVGVANLGEVELSGEGEEPSHNGE